MTDQLPFNCLLAAAKIYRDEGPQKASVGGSVKFTCKISGNPAPSTIWYKDGEKLNSSIKKRILIKRERNSSELEIESAQMSDQGCYTCVVKNDFGEHCRSFRLSVVEGNNDFLSYVVTSKVV